MSDGAERIRVRSTISQKTAPVVECSVTVTFLSHRLLISLPWLHIFPQAKKTQNDCF